MNLDIQNVTLTPPAPKNAVRRPLLTPLPEPGHFAMFVDNSSMEKFTTCPMSAYYYLVLGREAYARNAALTFGGALHAGLDLFLQFQWQKQQATDLASAPVIDDEYPRQLQAIENYFADNPAPLDDYRTVENCKEVMQHYRIRAAFPDYEWTICSDINGPLIERSFELPLGAVEVNADIKMPWLTNEQLVKVPGWVHLDSQTDHACHVSHIHIFWTGRMDAIAHCHGINRVIDHKTTSIMGDQFSQDFQLSNQVLGYVWAAQQVWPELNISGFCVNTIHFKKPSKSGASLTSGGVRGGAAPLAFERFYYQYSPERIQWWEHNALTLVEDFIHCLVRNYFPSHTKWCFGKYGKCSYHDVCSQDSADLRNSLIQSEQFKPVTWNPVR